MYATGNIDTFEEFTRKITWKTVLSYLDVIIPKNGLISGKRIYKLLSEYFGTKTIESLEISYCCTAEATIDEGYKKTKQIVGDLKNKIYR